MPFLGYRRWYDLCDPLRWDRSLRRFVIAFTGVFLAKVIGDFGLSPCWRFR